MNETRSTNIRRGQTRFGPARPRGPRTPRPGDTTPPADEKPRAGRRGPSLPHPAPPEPSGAVEPPRLYTPAQAAGFLAVKESWLRRKAGTRTIPCTFLGKHLRFSAADLHAITTAGSHTLPHHRRHGR